MSDIEQDYPQSVFTMCHILESLNYTFLSVNPNLIFFRGEK